MIGLTTRITKKLGLSLFSAFSHKNSLVNATPSKFVEQRASLKDNNWLTPDPTHKVSFRRSRDPLKLTLATESI